MLGTVTRDRVPVAELPGDVRPVGLDDEVVVLAAGRGDRLGLGPKAWLVLGGRTLLERAVATMRLAGCRVIVGVAASDLERARSTAQSLADLVGLEVGTDEDLRYS